MARSAEDKPFPIASIKALLITCVLLCAVVTFGYAGGNGAMAVLYRLLTDGLILIAWLVCAAGLGSAILLALPVCRGTDDREAILQIVTAAAIGIGLFSLATLGLGLSGLLNHITSLAMLGLGAGVGLLMLTRSHTWKNRNTLRECIRAWLGAPAGWSWLWLAAIPFLGIAIVSALLPPGVMWPQEPHPYDVVEYHLQIPREWYEIGRIVPLHHNAFSLFPFNVEMQYLLAIHLRGGPWAGMYLAHFMHLAMIVLTVAAVYGFAKKLSGSTAGATVAGVAVATVPWMTQLGTIAYNEGGLLLFGTLAMGWAFRAVVEPSHRLGRFPVAGLLAGFACGSKLTAVPEVLIAVGAIAMIALLFDALTSRVRSAAETRIFTDASDDEGIRVSASLRSRLGHADVPIGLRFAGLANFFLAGLLAFSPWLIRNQLWAGNPVFPEAADVLGQGHFSDAQVARWKQAHVPRPDQRPFLARLTAWRNGVWVSWQYGYALLPLGLGAGVAAAMATFTGSPKDNSRPRHSNVRANVGTSAFLLIAMFMALSAVWLGFTHLQGRFFILGVPIAGLLLATAPWGRVAVAVVAGVVLVAATLGFSRLHAVLSDRLLERKMTVLLGYENVSEVFVPPAYDSVPNDAPLALVGDARAFVYPGPMHRLFYRTVFDVDVQGGESVIDAWRRGAPAEAWVLVDPVELRRFHNTYASIPPLPPEYADRAEPFVIPPR